MRAIASQAVAHERAAGRFGEHADVDDVLLAISMVAGVLTRTEPDARAVTARRAWDLLHTAFVPRP
ncbi:hypothetical protein GCM10025870_17690 [Agromyces marinus]|uniref:TetR family transcriptional regulator n=1 Tax=Agromyces marinus TaxID=1389020 RepID=A0ABN6YC90_9MICO|nr:hypothetical protein [Agromyces marinus]BDZ54696.1 hypothetical protein GCM10025870_17690 [Agromyces marinus]